MWAVELWDEVESDFSVLHRVDDPYALPAPVFAARLGQLPHYPGAVRGRAMAELERSDSGQGHGAVLGQPAMGAGQRAGLPSGTQWVPDVTKSAAFAGIVTRGK